VLFIPSGSFQQVEEDNEVGNLDNEENGR